MIWSKKILKIQLFERPTSTTSALRNTFWYHFNFFLSSIYQYQWFSARKFWKFIFLKEPTSSTSAHRAIFWYQFNYFLSSTYQYQLFGEKIFWKFNFLKNQLQPHQHLETHFGTTSTIFWGLNINIDYLEQENFENSTFWKTHFNHIST